MKITFVGTSHGIAEKNRCCACTVLTVDKKHYIIDAGAPILDLLQRYDFKFEDIAGIFITHSHSDHMIGLYGFVDTINDFNEFSHISTTVYVPDIKRYNDTLALMQTYSVNRERVKFKKYETGFVFDDGVVKITSVATKHFENSHAFIIEAEGKKLAFTGDLAYDLSDYPVDIVNTDVDFDLVVMEAAHQAYDDEKTIDILKESKTKLMVINHIYSVKNPPEVLLNFKNKMKDKFSVIISYDGMTVDL